MKQIGRPLLIVASTLLVAVAARAQTVQPGGPLVVRDARNRLVGQLVSAYAVSMVVNGKVVILGAFRDGLTDQGAVLEFDQPNCQGNAFMLKSNVSGYLSTPEVWGPTGALHIIDLNTPVQTQMLMSYFQNTVIPSGQCTNQSALLATDAIPTVQTTFMRSQFTPPLSVAPALAGAAAVPGTGMIGLAAIAAGLAAVGLIRLMR